MDRGCSHLMHNDAPKASSGGIGNRSPWSIWTTWGALVLSGGAVEALGALLGGVPADIIFAARWLILIAILAYGALVWQQYRDAPRALAYSLGATGLAVLIFEVALIYVLAPAARPLVLNIDTLGARGPQVPPLTFGAPEPWDTMQVSTGPAAHPEVLLVTVGNRSQKNVEDVVITIAPGEHRRVAWAAVETVGFDAVAHGWQAMVWRWIHAPSPLLLHSAGWCHTLGADRQLQADEWCKSVGTLPATDIAIRVGRVRAREGAHVFLRSAGVGERSEPVRVDVNSEAARLAACLSPNEKHGGDCR